MAETIEQFGQRIKAKYPQYNDMSDADVGNRVLAKYPQYQDMIEKPAVESDKGFLGNKVASMIKPFARGATNVIQAGELAAGKTLTSPLSGSFLGQVEPIGMKNGGGPSIENLKDVAGVGLELASNIPLAKGGAITKELFKGAVKEGGKKALFNAALPLAKQGAIAGGLSSLGSSLQKNEDLESTVTNTALGTAFGGVAAPLFGVATAGVGSALGRKTNVGKLFDGGEIKETPAMNADKIKKVALFTRSPLDAAEKASMKMGKVETEYPFWGFGKKVNVVQDEDVLRAQAVKDYVDPKMSQVNENIARVNQAIREKYHNQFLPFLDQFQKTYDPNDMRTYLQRNITPSKQIRPGSDSDYAFKTIIQNGMDILNRAEPTVKGAQMARSEIDNMITKEFGDSIWDNTKPDHTGAKEAALKLRNAINGFSENFILTDGDMNMFNRIIHFQDLMRQRGMGEHSNEAVRDELFNYFGKELNPQNYQNAILFNQKRKNLSLMIEAVENMWQNSQKEVGKTRWQNTVNPFLKTAVGIGVPVALGSFYLGGRSGINNNTN